MRDHKPAGCLQPTVWILAQEMQHFEKGHYRSPASLDEISRHATAHDFSSLRAFPHEFTPTGPRRFTLRVNSRFAFDIDPAFVPNWSKPTPVIGTPTHSP